MSDIAEWHERLARIEKAQKAFVRGVGRAMRDNGWQPGAVHHQGPNVYHYRVENAHKNAGGAVGARVHASDILLAKKHLIDAGYQVHYMSGSAGQWPYLYVLPMVSVKA